MEQIPELVPRHIWLPSDSPARITPASEPGNDTTTPVEVGFAVYELEAGGIDDFSPERTILNLFEDGFSSSAQYLEGNMGNHVGRVLFRALLDPDRHVPINLLSAYRSESRFRGYSESEAYFFANFVQNWGVIKRS